MTWCAHYRTARQIHGVKVFVLHNFSADAATMALRVRVGDVLSIYAGTARALNINTRTRILHLSVWLSVALALIAGMEFQQAICLCARRSVLSCRAFSFKGGYQFLLLKHTNMRTNTCSPTNVYLK